MRTARSYSIVDHALLHGGYFKRLSHQALVLYLFLVVVGDRNGESFYRPGTIAGILRFSVDEILSALRELVNNRLIALEANKTRVLTITVCNEKRGTYPQGQISQGCRAAKLPPDRANSWHSTAEVLAAVLGADRRSNAGKVADT
jgi:hypothetical protein